MLDTNDGRTPNVMKAHRIATVAMTLTALVACKGLENWTADEDGTTDSTEVADTTAEDDPACTNDDDCDDGEICNGEETCGPDGECEAGIPLVDGTPCTLIGGDDGMCRAGTCVPLTCGNGTTDAGEDCDDGNVVPEDGCENDCLFSCHTGDECDDDNVCTNDACITGGTGQLCNHIDNTSPCDDGDPCTEPDICSGGNCIPGSNTCQCTTDLDCVPFEDGDLCNGTLICNPGTNTCVVDGSSIVECVPTGEDCSENVCTASTGACTISDLTEGTPCTSDSDACTTDECDGLGTCTHETIDCDDADDCTVDDCDAATGCSNTWIPGCCNTDADCDDSNACTTDTCDAASCVYETVDCDDDNICTDDSCDSTSGCVNDPNTLPCDDGDPCTDPDTCDGAGACSPGPDIAHYLDEDGDGYGTPGDSICTTSPPAGYVDNDEDCCDALASVRPSQTGWFADPYYCTPSDPASWDYDCDGYESHRWNTSATCSTYGGCHVNSGWREYPFPDCVDSDTWISRCGWVAGDCDFDWWYTRPQECH